MGLGSAVGQATARQRGSGAVRQPHGPAPHQTARLGDLAWRCAARLPDGSAAPLLRFRLADSGLARCLPGWLAPGRGEQAEAAEAQARTNGGGRDGGAAAERLEARVHDVAVLVHFDLQLHHIPARRRAHQPCAHAGIVLVEGPHVPGVTVVLHHILVVLAPRGALQRRACAAPQKARALRRARQYHHSTGARGAKRARRSPCTASRRREGRGAGAAALVELSSESPAVCAAGRCGRARPHSCPRLHRTRLPRPAPPTLRGHS